MLAMQAFDRRQDAEKSADEEGGQVVEWSPETGTRYVVVIYVPTAIHMPK